MPSGERSAHLPQGQSGQLVVPAAVGHFRHRSGPPDGAGTDEVYPLADGDVGEVVFFISRAGDICAVKHFSTFGHP